MPDNKRNERFVVLTVMFRALALQCATGPVMQTFLASLGFPSQYLYLHSTLTQAANVLTIFLCARWADQGNLIRRTAWIQVPYAVLSLAVLPLCLWHSPTLGTFLTLTGICLLQAVFLALYTVCEYKLPYYIYPPERYGPLSALCGIASSVLTLFSGTGISWLATRLPYDRLMLYASLAGAILMAASAVLTALFRPIYEAPQTAKVQPKVPLKKVLLHPVFFRLLPANLFRGFSFGTTTVLAAVALDLGFQEGVLTALVPIQALAGLVGCGIYGLSARSISPRKMILCGSLCFLVIPLMFLPGNGLFLAAVTVLMVGRTLVDYAVPTTLRYAVPVEIAGPYNAWRMLLHNAGTLAATAVAAVLPVHWLLMVTMTLQLLSGLRYLTLKELRQVV